MIPEKQGILFRLGFFAHIQERIQYQGIAHALSPGGQLFLIQRDSLGIDEVVCQCGPVSAKAREAGKDIKNRIRGFGIRRNKFFLLFGRDRQICRSCLQRTESFRELFVVQCVDCGVMLLFVQVGVEVRSFPACAASGTDENVHPVRLIFRGPGVSVHHSHQGPGAFSSARFQITAAEIHKDSVIRVRFVSGTDFAATAAAGGAAAATAAAAAAGTSGGTAAAASGRRRHELQDPLRDPYGQVLGVGLSAAGLIGCIDIGGSKTRFSGIRDIRVRHQSPDGVKG